MMDSKLKTFIIVCETKSYTKAGECLHLTQPAITQHIKQLEQYYGIKLIEHPHKEFVLSEAGKQLYSYAKIQLRNEEIFESRIHSITTPLVIGATLSVADYFLADFLNTYLLENKQGKIVVDNTATLLKKMIDGKVDCAFVEGKFDTSLFAYHLFAQGNFIPAIRVQHPLAKKVVSLQDVITYPLYLREQGSGTRAILESYLQQSVYTISSFEKTIEIESMTLIKELLIKSNGISFLYEKVVEEELKNKTLTTLQLPNFPLRHDIYFIYLKSNLKKDSLAQMFSDTMQEN